MSGTLTPYGRGLLLTAVFLHDTYATPAGLWVAYTRTVPVSNADGAQLDEPSSGYARAPAGLLTSANWAFTGFQEVYNVNVIVFAGATDDWGLITGYALVDAEAIETGNVIAVGTQVEPFEVVNGEAPSIDIAGIAVGLYD